MSSFKEQSPLFQSVKSLNADLKDWLFNHALPLWSTRGVDCADGGFFELIDQNGTVIEAPRRTRVVSRQIFVFSVAMDLGWPESNTAVELVDHGLEFLLKKSLSESGTFYSSVTSRGKPVRPDFDLYDHAFALFALARLARASDHHHHPMAINTGRRVVEVMLNGWKHPEAGFEEASPPTEPLRSNPHMHLLEACLEWEEAGEYENWHWLTDEISELALRRFIDPNFGGVREAFDHNWYPASDLSGRILEPGHQFEWAWLLWRWASSRGRPDVFDVSRRLTEVGDRGINHEGLVINSLWENLSIRETDCRLWPQTERLKAYIAVAELDGLGADRTDQTMSRLIEAANGITRYFQTSVPGLWHETLTSGGRPLPAPARASSLYHIVCAMQELERFIRRHDNG